jgi:hypothetical protein
VAAIRLAFIGAADWNDPTRGVAATTADGVGPGLAVASALGEAAGDPQPATTSASSNPTNALCRAMIALTMGCASGAAGSWYLALQQRPQRGLNAVLKSRPDGEIRQRFARSLTRLSGRISEGQKRGHDFRFPGQPGARGRTS